MPRDADEIREMLEAAPPLSDRFTTGRYVLASTDAEGARDPIGLTSQVKYMRNGMESVGHTPALILVVVHDPELESAVDRIRGALDERRSDG